MNSPLVSVITAAYRTYPQQLRAALESALRQSYENLEITVSDDSPDSSLETVVDALGDKRLRYRRNEPRLGVADNHWKSIREARGELLVILNHDDVLEATFIEELLRPLQRDADMALAFCDHWIIDTAGNRLTTLTEATSERDGRRGLAAGPHHPFEHLLVRQSIQLAVAAMFRRACVPHRLPSDAGPAYDLWLTYLLCRSGYGAWYVPERLSSWRHHSSNLTSAANIDWLSGAAHCWADVARYFTDASIIAAARRKEALAHRACARWYYQRRRNIEARAHARRSLRADCNWKAAALYGAACLPLSFGRAVPQPGSD